MVRKRKLGEIIDKGLITIPDDLVLSERKPNDHGINTLIDEYNHLSDKNSGYKDITDETTGHELKVIINGLVFEEKLLLVYRYLNAIGKVDPEKDMERDIQRFKHSFIKWSLIVGAVMASGIFGGSIAMGVFRGDIDTNEVFKIFMLLVTKVAEIFLTGKPVVE